MKNKIEKIKLIPHTDKKYFYNYPQIIVVVGVESNGKKNVIPVAWSTSLSYSPFLYGISIGLDRHTHKLLSDADSFTVNFIDFRHASTVRPWGRSSCSEIDKIKKFNIEIHPAEKINAPILDLAYCTFECVKKKQILIGDHTLFVGQVAIIHIDKNAIGNNNTLNTDLVSPLLYLGIDNFITLDNTSRLSLKHLPFYYKSKKNK